MAKIHLYFAIICVFVDKYQITNQFADTVVI